MNQFVRFLIEFCHHIPQNNNIKPTIIKTLGFFIFSFSIGYYLHSVLDFKFPIPTTKLFSETRYRGNYHFINPLLECDSINFEQDRNLDFLRNKLNSLISAKINQGDITFASVYYRDLNNGPWMGINEKELFSPASLVKVPIMMAYFKLAESDPSILNKKIDYNSTVKTESQNILPSVTLVTKKSYTVEELIYNMIVYSDNTAYELLQNNIDNNLIVNTYTDLGIDISRGFSDPAGNIISVKSYASFFRILYNSSYLSKNLSEKALNILSQVQFRDALVKGVPTNIPVSHKFGERNYEATGEKQLHDCGIVYSTTKPYLICIMTRGRDFSRLATSIASISQTIYQEIYPTP